MIRFKEINKEYGFFSNDYPESFTVEFLTFSSMTQYLMFCKASLFGDKALAWKICNEWDTRILRDYGTVVTGFDELLWKGQRSYILARGLRAKFDQNPSFIADLLRTGEEMLVCCDPLDHEFGVGLWPDDPEALDPDTWKGSNLLGFALMDLRSVYQAKLPEGSLNAIREKTGAGGKIGLMEALDGVGIKMREDECRYAPYTGEEPYIYLSFSPADLSDAFWFVGFLNRQGFRVWYDRYINDGRLWTAERSDAIERSFLVMDFDNGEKEMSPIRILAREFAEIIEIPVVEFEMPKEREEIKALRETCPALLKEEGGLVPGMTWPEGEKQREPKWDLVLQYYEHYAQKYYSKPWDKDWRWANLRTREVFDSRNRTVTGKVKPRLSRGRYVERPEEPLFLSEAEFYRAALWKRRSFDAVRKSDAPDYIGMPKDWLFSKRLSNLQGQHVPEVAQQYRDMKARFDRDMREYPYMDEFEYVNTRGED